jgi:hypothetical protein
MVRNITVKQSPDKFFLRLHKEREKIEKKNEELA